MLIKSLDITNSKVGFKDAKGNSCVYCGKEKPDYSLALWKTSVIKISVLITDIDSDSIKILQNKRWFTKKKFTRYLPIELIELNREPNYVGICC